MKRLLFGLLALILLLPQLAACAGEEIAATAEEGVVSGEDAVASYLRDLRSGVYDDSRLFGYEDLSEYFVLGEYRGLRYPDDDYLRTEVTDQEVENYLVVMLMNGAITDDDYTLITEGTVQLYDVAHITYEGAIDGVTLDSACTGEDGADLVIGSGTYIPGFESGLLGAAIGSTVTLDLAFSPYYGDDTVAGKAIRFTVTVGSVQRPTLPEITVDLINELYDASFTDMDSVRASLRASLNETRAGQAQSAVATYLQERILENGEIKAYPEREMQHYRDHFQAYFEQYAESQEKSLEEYLAGQGYTMEEFKAQMETYAKTSCEGDLLIFSIARAENIAATDEQISALITGLFENNTDFSSPEEMIEYYISVYGPFYFENRVVSLAVMELVEEAAIKESVS